MAAQSIEDRRGGKRFEHDAIDDQPRKGVADLLFAGARRDDEEFGVHWQLPQDVDEGATPAFDQIPLDEEVVGLVVTMQGIGHLCDVAAEAVAEVVGFEDCREAVAGRGVVAADHDGAIAEGVDEGVAVGRTVADLQVEGEFAPLASGALKADRAPPSSSPVFC